MANGLISYVHVTDEAGLPAVFSPDDELPAWALDKIGAHAFENGEKPKPKPARKSADA